MDFFRAQDDARHRTRLLVGLFLLSLICLLAMANLILYFVLDTTTEPTFFIGVSVAILLIVFASSFYKSVSLRQGGEAVAQMLNARLLAEPSSNAEQRLLNVVEEMAIASGTPVPPVYVMEETAINAFAAGHSINDAVIGVTRGAIEKLNRDELQGVIAHEFSHILHGDMRLNLRLIAWLHGIMVLGIMGHYIIRGASVSRRNNNNAGVAMFGLGLIVLGASGQFFGGLIKAAVSRQREYLADASAVQYTRNPHGIAGALKRIAVDSASPVLENPATPQISHALFSEGVSTRFSSLFATHPPLEERIQVLDPQWDGEYQITEVESLPSEIPATQSRQSAFTPLAIALAISRAGAPDNADIINAQEIHRSLPELWTNTAHNPLGAAATLCLLLMQEEILKLQSGELEAEKFERLFVNRTGSESSRSLLAEMTRMLTYLDSIEARHRLPLVNICLGSLRQMSAKQYQSYRRILSAIIDSDTSPDLDSWVLYQLSIHHLDRAFGLSQTLASTSRVLLSRSTEELEIFFSLLSHCGHRDAAEAEAAFKAAVTAMDMPQLKSLASDRLDPVAFQQATENLVKLTEADKKRLLNAVGVCVYHDKQLTVAENELLRMTYEMLDLPLPANIDR